MSPHPNIINFTDFYILSDQFVLVTDALHLNLLEYMNWKYNTLTESEIRDIFRAVVKAVEACHQNGIIHRDIKPENIYLRVEQDGDRILEVKLGDFGLACCTDAQTEHQFKYGTVGYMAPEIISKEKVYDMSVDAYALGVLLFNLITGKMPFTGSSK